MISEVVLPQMGADMEEGTIVRWLKNEGDPVERGEIIAEIETDKANVEIEAFESGLFRKTLASEGDTVDVGTVIAIIAAQDDDIAAYEKGAVAAAAPAAEKADAKEATVEKAEVAAKPTKPPAGKDGRVRASPVARKLAEERGIDLATLAGTGPDGRIVRRDVDARIEKGPAPEKPPVPAAVEVVGVSKMRQAIARRMSQSKREAPHYYITLDIDMTDAERLRRQLRESVGDELRVSVNDLIVKASAMALERHPDFNTWLVDGEVRRHEAINVCIAIALEDGLIAPAILDCGNKRVAEIGSDSRSLAERAKSGKLRPAEISDGTFTVSNVGMFGVTSLIAIIQPPQTAILGVGAVRETPVVRDGRVEVASMMTVALSADHRVTDGAQGAQFLSEIRTLLQNPAGLLV